MSPAAAAAAGTGWIVVKETNIKNKRRRDENKALTCTIVGSAFMALISVWGGSVLMDG